MTRYFDSLPIELISLSLMHFLWQACIVGSIAAVGFASLRRSPNGRYLWGVLCFAGLAVCPAATLFWLQPAPPVVDRLTQPEAVDVVSIRIHPIGEAIRDVSEGAELSLVEPFDLWQVGHVLIVAIWLVGQIFVGCRLLVSGYFVHWLKQVAVPVDVELRKVAHRLANKLGILCPLIATTDRITVAMAAGFFRQIIVIPSAWLTEMTPDMLEAVISHELAHLRRHDQWINLFQRIVESVLFFHPIVWWLSKRIRHDREICCDLLAIGATKQRRHYAETLEHVARMGAARSTLLVTQIGDDRMSLLTRVRLVLGQQQQASSLGWWPAGLLAIVIPCGLVWMSHTPPSFAQQKSEAAQPSTARDIQAHNRPIHEEHRVDEIVRMAKADGRLTKKWKLGEYTIEPPDIVTISIDHAFDSKDAAEGQEHGVSAAVCGEHLVAADGTVNLGIYGRVYIAGMTTEKATAAIRERLAKHAQNEPKVSLDVLVINSKFFYVLIESSDAGDQVVRIPVTGNETVLDAISQIGGIGHVGNKQLYIKRPGHNGHSDQVLPIDWDAIIRGNSTTSNYQLLPGDRLFVSAKGEQGFSPIRAASHTFGAKNGSASIGVPLPSPYYDYDLGLGPKPAAPSASSVRQILTASRPSLYGSARQQDGEQVPTKSGLQGELPRREQFQHRIPLMGPMTTKGKAEVIDPPNDEEVLRLVQVGLPDSALAQPENRKYVEIAKELIADYVDPPRLYPLIGPAQLHHAHYKYVVVLGKGGKSPDGESAPQILFIDHQHLHASDEIEVSEPEAAASPSRSESSEMIVEAYYVADLVLPIRKPRFTESGEQERVKGADPDFDTLIELISATIAPNSWDEVGGDGSIESFEGNLSLVVSQTPDVHNEIKVLLVQLRRLQETKVVLRATDLKLTESLTNKLGLHGKLLAVLTAEETKQILEAAKRDARARTFADSKATLFNGQSMAMAIADDQTLQMQAVVGADRDSVRFVAGLRDASGTEVTQSAQLTNEQSLLVRMKDVSQKDGTAIFRMITSEPAERNEENRESPIPRER